MTAGLTFKGSVEVGAGCAVTSGCASSVATMMRVIAARCGAFYQSVVASPEPIRIATLGNPGAAWADLNALDDLTSIEFFYITSDQPILVRIGAEIPTLIGVGGIFPTGFVGAETLNIDFDGLVVAVVFLIGDQSAAQVVARINAACALAGLPTPRAVVSTSGQIQIDGINTGTNSTLKVPSGTGAAAIGFGAFPSDSGAGADVPLWGTMLIEFPSTGGLIPPPARIQVSGTANVSVVAAGR